MILAPGGSRLGSVQSKHMFALSVLALGAFLAHPARAAQPDSAAPNPAIAAYTHHLAELQTLVAACQKQRTPEACDPAQVGSNDHVPWPPTAASAQREISYDWLRTLLSDAAKPQAGKDSLTPPGGAINSASAAKTPAPSIDTQLTEARQRLAADAQQVAQPPQAIADYSAQRRALHAILAERQYQGVAQTTVREHFLEWFGNLLNEILGRLIRFGARSPWIAFVLRALLLGGLCLLLIWFLIRIERRSRIRLIEDGPGLSAAPSARNWQLWLRDAQAMAAQSLWREGIHFLYWAAIARLESRHLWPADRARTPREYLLLLPAADPRRAGLTALTKTFERTWYGGREAGAADYQTALHTAAELGVE
jgi:Domain of unknown function (DUF4129)